MGFSILVPDKYAKSVSKEMSCGTSLASCSSQSTPTTRWESLLIKTHGSTSLRALYSYFGTLDREKSSKGTGAAMVWMSVLIWIAAFTICIFGIFVLVQTGITDFKPWEKAKRRLIIAGILVAAPADALAFHFLPPSLAIILGVAVTILAVINFVIVVPK